MSCDGSARIDSGDEPTRFADAALQQVGLRAEYFADYLDLLVDRVEPTLDHDWGDRAPDPRLGKDGFSARFTGSLVAPVTGSYQLITDTDDGVRLWLDGKRVIDDWQGHFVTRNRASVELVAGVETPLRVDYFEYDLAASARLSWSAIGLGEQVIPTSSLRAAAQASGLPGPKPPYGNPVIAGDCPDPGVLVKVEAGGPLYVMVCTGGSFPIRTSRDLVRWRDGGAAVLPAGKPPWAANGGRNWAPEIHQVGSRFVAYYTSVNGANVLSIGVAHASSPLGPFAATNAPLVEHPYGVIDATFFQDDDGSRWLFDKVDGNSQGKPTPLRARRLAADGLSFASGSVAHEVLTNDPATWEGGVVEAPWVVKRLGFYYLFYSGNVYDHRYRTGVARATHLLGPYQKHGAPILGNNARWVGPGHGSAVQLGALDYFVYHAWTHAGDGTALGSAGRQVLVDRIQWLNGWPTIAGGTPSHTAQPWPGEP